MGKKAKAVKKTSHSHMVAVSMFAGISVFDNVQSKQLHFVSYTSPVCGTYLRITWKNIRSISNDDVICLRTIQTQAKRDNSFYVCTPMSDFFLLYVFVVAFRTVSGKNSELG